MRTKLRLGKNVDIFIGIGLYIISISRLGIHLILRSLIDHIHSIFILVNSTKGSDSGKLDGDTRGRFIHSHFHVKNCDGLIAILKLTLTKVS